jgi:hypothetical protein
MCAPVQGYRASMGKCVTGMLTAVSAFPLIDYQGSQSGIRFHPVWNPSLVSTEHPASRAPTSTTVPT